MVSPRSQVMATYLPRYYESSRVMQSLMHVEGEEFDQLRGALTGTLDQFTVRSATWGLDIWEKELGLSPAQEQTEDERKDRIVSRLRGVGTATISKIREVAEAYSMGAVDVVEDYENYTIKIIFIDTTGVPSNLNDLKEVVRAVLPAHLAHIFEFNYFIWSELDAMEWTWDQLDALQLTWDQMEVYR